MGTAIFYIQSVTLPCLQHVWNGDLSHREKREVRFGDPQLPKPKEQAEPNKTAGITYFCFNSHQAGGHLNNAVHKKQEKLWHTLGENLHIIVVRIKIHVKGEKSIFKRVNQKYKGVLSPTVTKVQIKPMQTFKAHMKRWKRRGFFVSWQKRSQPLDSFPQLIKWSRLKKKK